MNSEKKKVKKTVRFSWGTDQYLKRKNHENRKTFQKLYTKERGC